MSATIGSALVSLLTAQFALAGLGTAIGRPLLEYDRAAVDAGEWWRLLSAAYVHTNAAHLALNATGLVLLLLLLNKSQRLWLTLGLPVLSVLVYAGEHLFLDHSWACGLSGPLHAAAAALVAVHRPHWTLYVVALGALVKAAFEVLQGPAQAAEALIGAPVLVDHHALGAVIGLTAAAAAHALRYTRHPRRPGPPPCTQSS